MTINIILCKRESGDKLLLTKLKFCHSHTLLWNIYGGHVPLLFDAIFRRVHGFHWIMFETKLERTNKQTKLHLGMFPFYVPATLDCSQPHERLSKIVGIKINKLGISKISKFLQSWFSFYACFCRIYRFDAEKSKPNSVCCSTSIPHGLEPRVYCRVEVYQPPILWKILSRSTQKHWQPKQVKLCIYVYFRKP